MMKDMRFCLSAIAATALGFLVLVPFDVMAQTSESAARI